MTKQELADEVTRLRAEVDRLTTALIQAAQARPYPVPMPVPQRPSMPDPWSPVPMPLVPYCQPGNTMYQC
jgi:hypothetical protein